MLHGTHINPEDRYKAVIVRGVVKDKYWLLMFHNYIKEENECCHSEIIIFVRYYSFYNLSLMPE